MVKRRRVERVGSHYREGKRVKGYKRKPKPKAKRGLKTFRKKYTIVFTRDSQGRIVGKKRYIPL